MSFIKKMLLILLLSPMIVLAQKPTLIFYCGITMVKPMKEIAKIIEKKFDCNINISQGGSKDLYDALKYSHKGDLYLPGSESYRINNLKDGFFKDFAFIGYNQAAIFVQKNNPKNIKSLDDFTSGKFASILANTQSGSIGKMTKQLFIQAKGEGFYLEAYDLAAQIGSDSRSLNNALLEQQADLTINWKATAFWKENQPFIDIIELDEKVAPKKKLIINLLSFSKHPFIAKKFIEYAASKEGQEIMKKYGFLN